MNVHQVLIVLAWICFVLDAVGAPLHPSVKLLPLGLALWVASLIL